MSIEYDGVLGFLVRKDATDGRWMKVRNNTYVRLKKRDDVDVVEVRHHETVIAVLYPDTSVRLDSGGYTSKTTIERMNMCIEHLHARVYRLNDELFVSQNVNSRQQSTKFYDSIIIWQPKHPAQEAIK